MVPDPKGMSLRDVVRDLGITTVGGFMLFDFTHVDSRAGRLLQALQQRANLYEIMYVMT